MRLLIFIPLLALAAACSSYQYYTLNSSLPENDQKAFTLENDTLSLTYTFWGNGGPVQLVITNKLDVPLIIDWKKSSIIVDGYTNPYWRDQAAFDATNYFFSISGMITKPTHESFIPPHASLESTSIQLMPKYLNFGPNTAFERVPYHGVLVKRYTFSADDSPLVFRSYLSFRLNENPDYFHYDHHFWATEAWQSLAAPGSLVLPDQHFYTSKPSGFGAVVGVLAVGGLIWVALEANPTVEE